MTQDTNPDLGARAREVIDAARQTDWSPTQQAVLNAMLAKWYAAVPCHQVQRIAEALEGLPRGSLGNTQKVLTALVRRKVLSSRSIKGTTYYSVVL